jgi:Transposase DDE domain group 1
VFGIDAGPKLADLATSLSPRSWKRLQRPMKYTVKTTPRGRRANVKERVVIERGFESIRLRSEDVAEFFYQPGACRRPYRIVAVRKNLSVEKGECVLFDDVRYFFYITNDETTPADELVMLANDRCNQENLIEQLKNGVHAMRMPVNSTLSNGAYMVMASLAWTLKAWFALSLPETGRGAEQRRVEKQTVLRMEFRAFQRSFIAMPCQIVRAGRKIIYRLLSWNPWQRVFLRGVEALRLPLRC